MSIVAKEGREYNFVGDLFECPLNFSTPGTFRSDTPAW